MRIILALFLVAVVSTSYSWNLPNLPSGKRTQYFVIHDDGGYKYGYDTGKNYFAKQLGDSHNEVAGHYVYKDKFGKDVDVKYTAGVNGFVPEGLDDLLPKTGGPHVPVQTYSYQAYSSDSSTDDQSNTEDASYSFNIDTDSYKRQESSDAGGNVQGRYSYTNQAGQHDLSYIAGSGTGFVATSGSLSVPNGVEGSVASRTGSYVVPEGESLVNTDGSYSFGYSAPDSSRQESSDASGNVQGRYAYTNQAGTHDLSYVAGSATGFVATGGSLSLPNGLPDQSGKSAPSGTPISAYSAQNVAAQADTSSVANADGSYTFGYSAPDSSRQESSDASGNVQGRYSYTNQAGTHDLSYVAGSATGFVATGGSLSLPNGLPDQSGKSAQSGTPISAYSAQNVAAQADTSSVANADGSYSFGYSAPDSSRQESSDASGNVQGRYSYTNQAGTHDLSYVAGSETGFVATGGSLSVPNGLEGSVVPSTYSGPTGYLATSYSAVPTDYTDSTDSTDDQTDTGDASYSFTVDTDEYKRQESSDAQGNVKGSFSYNNAAGQHDLSFVAGSQTGFVPTGGSLSLPNGLQGPAATYSGNIAPIPYSSVDQQNSGDASYSFTVDTPEYQRAETADPQGNIKGRYSYTNKAGSHDLSYVAGSSTGFVATGGSLSVPSGMSGAQVGTNVPAIAAVRYFDHPAHPTQFETKLGNVLVKTYLPPGPESKYGYIFEST